MNHLVSLHTHSWYSLLEGVSSPDALLHRAASCGYYALALTDTNNLYGAVPFVEAAKRGLLEGRSAIEQQMRIPNVTVNRQARPEINLSRLSAGHAMRRLSALSSGAG